MSRLLEAACEEAKSGNQNIRDRVRHIGNKFINAVEISAQEAVYLVLQMPLRRASRQFQFLNTCNSDERVVLLKTMDKIQQLPDNSENIESDNLLKRYQRRPRQLEKVCLADFAAWYNYVKSEECDIETQGYESYGQRFEQLKLDISQNRERYEYNSEVLEKAIQCLNNDLELSEGVAPCTQHNDEQDQNEAVTAAELSDCFNPEKERQNNDRYNLLDDFGIFPRAHDDEELLVYRMEDNRYRELARSLNKEQMEFFYHVLHSVKTTSNQLTLFLRGGAGCGKTTVTNCLYESLIRYLNSAGENPDEMKVLKLAPTGKAAFIINGNTLHSALKIPVNRGFEYCRLDNDRLNTMRAVFKDLRLIFIDEISMVGCHLFQFLNLRLKEVMNVTKPFGGIHIITVGDLFQLKPVFDKWIFENSLQGYGCLSTNIWQEYFSMYELSEIMRQKDDKDFAELLNRVREIKAYSNRC
ncbi:hypothetical protein ACROYT_G011383 [Oculina patagonica]